MSEMTVEEIREEVIAAIRQVLYVKPMTASEYARWWYGVHFPETEILECIDDPEDSGKAIVTIRPPHPLKHIAIDFEVVS